jgi:hypothetical protein
MSWGIASENSGIVVGEGGCKLRSSERGAIWVLKMGDLVFSVAFNNNFEKKWCFYHL